MKKIVSINLGDFGSTGKIMSGISKLAEHSDYITYMAFPIYSLKKKYYSKNEIIIGNPFYRWISSKFLYYFGFDLGFSFFSTVCFINKLRKLNPDIIHLHNLHGHYINLALLFNYIKKNNIEVIWTLHDCWSFTGHCPHFDMIGCDKWETGCYKCPQYHLYPKSKFDDSKRMYKLKKKLFLGIKDLTIVTPSRWLADLVKKSFLKVYPVKVINNGIDLETFKPTESDFRKKYNCENKFIILGVAFGWGTKKGLDVFIELSKRLDEHFQIVLVGTDENVDKKLPENIISIHRTQNQSELAEIYTVADLFINPTREEVLGLVNIEALACGTPVVTFNTGGAPECIDDASGVVVEKNNINAMYNEIIQIFNKKPFISDTCIKRAKNFDMNDKFKEYVDLYAK